MLTIQGKIDKLNIDEGMGRNGKPYKRWIYEIQGKKYSTFDEGIGNNFKIGDFVEIGLKWDGKYQNMVSMKKVESEASNQEKQANSTDIEDLLRKIHSQLMTTNAELKTISHIMQHGNSTNTA